MTINRRRMLSLTAGAGLVGTLAVATSTTAWAANHNDIAWKFFRGKGFTAAQTAGLIGNFIVESGTDPINPGAIQYGGGPGRGIAQWEGGRRTNLFNYANSRGLAWSNLQLQLDFVWKEFMGPEVNAYNKLKAVNTYRDAAVTVRQYYERPSAHADEARISWASVIYSRYGNDGGTTPPTSETNFPTVKQGSAGLAVTTLQYLLRSRGWSLLTDGQFGPVTLAAVRAFQKSKGLVVDGVVGPRTWGGVIVTVRRGSTGEAVKGLQVELRGAGKNLLVDGSLGPVTANALASYQKANGLIADAVAGPITWGSLVD